MKQDYDIFMNQVAEEIRSINAPKQIDVTDAVMGALQNKSIIAPRRQYSTWKKGLISVAACFLIALAVNITTLYTRSYDESVINDMFAELYDYGDQYGQDGYGYEDFSTANYIFTE